MQYPTDLPALRSFRRLAAPSLAVALVLAAAGCGADEGDEATVDPTTSVAPPTTVEPTVPPTTVPPTSEPAPVPTLPPDQRYETITSVIDDGTGTRACFVVLESLPPQCGTGIDLDGWSWDAIDVEQVDGSVTWVDQIHLSGTYDPADGTFAVDGVRLPSNDDRERILMSRPMPDYSIPCTPPPGGWPERTQDWPGDEVSAIDGYVGAWTMEPGNVMVVKFTGDLAAAEAAVREVYSDAICVVEGTRTEAELSAIQEDLQSLSSVHVLSSSIYVDATGEWVEAELVAPDPARQAALDEEYGEGVVRLRSALRPITT